MDAIYLYDPSTMRVLEGNPAFAKLLGYTDQEVPGLSLYDFVAHEREDTNRNITRLLKTGSLEATERKWRDKGGREIDVQVYARRLPQRRKDILFVVARDITEHKLLEAKLLRSAKLESLSTLAGGLAHDFNNFLMSILLNVGTARMQAEGDEELLGLLKAAEESIGKAKGISQQLLTFTRGGEPVKSMMILGPLIKDAVKFSLHGSKVSPTFQLPDDLWPAEIDAGQINQVIDNLTINAVQAMPDGGHLTVTVKNLTVGVDDPRKALKAGPYLEVAITDDGAGIPPDIIALIFDPYFTTRKQGSGLGLFSCYSIITQHGGWITVNSEPGKGATFTFFLPAAGDVEVTADGPPLLQRGSGRVLVMDDEETIRRGLAALLETLGYEVVVTADGADAIEAYRERLEQKEPFDVVIMDLTVPGGMGGGVAVQRLQELDPQVKTIVSSGYATDPIMAKHKEYGFQGVLVKPFTPEDLSKVMKEVLA